MKNLANKFREGVKKLVLPVAATAILSTVAIQDVDAQRKQKFPENHDNGAVFFNSKGNSEYNLEEKIFYNQVTGKDERFYMQYIDKEKYTDDLDIVALDFYKTIPKMNLKTGKVSELTSKDGMYIYFPEKLENGKLANSIVIDNLHIGDWCEDQIRDRAGVTKGINYISISDLKNLLPEHERLKTGDGRDFIVLTVAKERQVEGKTNHYLVEVDDKHEVGFNPVTKKPIIYGSIYRGNLEKGPVAVDAQLGMGGELGRDESFKEQEEPTEEKETSTPKKKDLYVIFGANANDKFFEGQVGVQYGPFALVGNLGKAKDEIVLDGQTDPSINGRYAKIKEENVDMSVAGISAELHPFSNKKISPFIGAGINNWKYTEKKLITMFGRNNQELGSDSESNAISENSYKAYAGLDAKFGNKSGLGIQAGYDSRTKFFGGVRYSLKLGK